MSYIDYVDFWKNPFLKDTGFALYSKNGVTLSSSP